MKEMIEIIRSAGELIRDAHIAADDITSKEGRANYVTRYDVKVQEYLFEKLSEVIPQASFVGEESPENQKIGEGYTFIIDPIDGTSNFICDYRGSCISVGLALDGQMIRGVVYNPYADEMYYAERGKGAYLNGQRLKIRDRTLSEGLVSFGTATYDPELTEPTFCLARAALERSMDVRRLGSAALDICNIAANRIVLFYELSLSCWDYAAAWLILEEAGGILTTVDGEAADLNRKRSVMAAVPTAHKEFLPVAAGIRAKGNFEW